MRKVDAMEPLSVADGIAISPQELGKFDVTVANILAAPILRLEPVFAYFTRTGKRPYSGHGKNCVRARHAPAINEMTSEAAAVGQRRGNNPYAQLLPCGILTR